MAPLLITGTLNPRNPYFKVKDLKEWGAVRKGSPNHPLCSGSEMRTEPCLDHRKRIVFGSIPLATRSITIFELALENCSGTLWLAVMQQSI
jgi:hypothetical protein